MNSIFRPFMALKFRPFAQLYFAQTVSLIGDAFTWVGVALLAFQFGGKNAAAILSTALTLRVVAFILFGPYAGVLADKIDRKKILYTTHFIRMGIVACLPFISNKWQLFVLMFFLNVFNAFFTPAYKAALPQLVGKKENYADAISLSNATWQLLGVLGPGMAGVVAVWLGARQIFFVDAASFVLAAILIITIPGQMIVRQPVAGEATKPTKTWPDILKGTKLLFGNPAIRFALFIELVAAIAGAQILVNTVTYIKGTLHLTDKYYGYVMMAFGAGATIAAFSASIIDKSKDKTALLITGAALLTFAIAGANFVAFIPLLGLWLMAGLGQSFTEIPNQIIIAENIPAEEQGKVYGAHFAWSHLWWAIAYPIAGFTGTRFQGRDFLIGGCISLVMLLLLCLYYMRLRKATAAR